LTAPKGKPARDVGPTPAQLEAAAATFDMLSTPTRLHVMWLLCHGEHDVGWLADQVGATVPAISQHLAKLRLHGLVSARRDGRHQIYRADDPHIVILVDQAFARLAPAAADHQAAPGRGRARPATRAL
jgi:DNA-binding transcriptional ArsR family regulator